MEEILKLALENLIPIIMTIFTGVLLPAIHKLLGGLYHDYRVKIKNQYLAQIIELCEQAVRHQYQIRIREMKKRVDLSDGIQPHEIAMIKVQARQAAIGTVQEIVKGFPAIVRDLFEDKIEHFVEAAIPKVKAKDRGIPGINPDIQGAVGK